jgi:hypothetical protein
MLQSHRSTLGHVPRHVWLPVALSGFPDASDVAYR